MDQQDLMRMFYAAVSAVQDGKCAEIELEQEHEDEENETMDRITITVRSEVKPFVRTNIWPEEPIDGGT